MSLRKSLKYSNPKNTPAVYFSDPSTVLRSDAIKRPELSDEKAKMPMRSKVRDTTNRLLPLWGAFDVCAYFGVGLEAIAEVRTTLVLAGDSTFFIAIFCTPSSEIPLF